MSTKNEFEKLPNCQSYALATRNPEFPFLDFLALFWKNFGQFSAVIWKIFGNKELFGRLSEFGFCFSSEFWDKLWRKT